ncbi:hypothetical protein EGR_10515 [Echinococcus granulosus]|uniref:Uncharacterized protein n=1 Tax=Echinococcus granulosus TaxID=6210 RepID=W6U891_ECHGR|nr:hypothetical protein EGR_10515 [Echinococcus granulosus]EUB54622.1 hypothetical protein EGR_10515 [Echinococcus granulosus]
MEDWEHRINATCKAHSLQSRLYIQQSDSIDIALLCRLRRCDIQKGGGEEGNTLARGALKFLPAGLNIS